MTTWLERFNLVIFGAALLVGAGLRWLQINTRSFWYDEALSSLIASLSVSQIVANAAGSVHPPGYYLLLHYFCIHTLYNHFILNKVT